MTQRKQLGRARRRLAEGLVATADEADAGPSPAAGSAPAEDRPASTTGRDSQRRLPGDPDRRTQIERLVRVDHAGEYGAKRIYEGQIAVLGETETGPLLRHMKEQEQVHLDYFERQLVERRIRPTALHPLWHVFGFALGAGTALMGKRAAMACTVAVEEVIDRHYARQAERLDENEAELRTTIERFRAEEEEHRDIGIANEAELTPAYRLLSGVIKVGCRAAIWASERV